MRTAKDSRGRSVIKRQHQSTQTTEELEGNETPSRLPPPAPPTMDGGDQGRLESSAVSAAAKPKQSPTSSRRAGSNRVRTTCRGDLPTHRRLPRKSESNTGEPSKEGAYQPARQPFANVAVWDGWKEVTTFVP